MFLYKIAASQLVESDAEPKKTPAAPVVDDPLALMSLSLPRPLDIDTEILRLTLMRDMSEAPKNFRRLM